MRNPEPLTSSELQRLMRWERSMMRFHTLAIPALLLCAAAAFFWSDATWLRRSLLVLVLALVVSATVLQLREKCPRCGARLRTTMLLRLPQRCHYCGVAFERQEPR